MAETAIAIAKKARKGNAGAEQGLTKVKATAKSAQSTPAAAADGVREAGKKKKRKLEVMDTQPDPAVKKTKTSKKKKAASVPGSESSNASETTEMPGATPAKPADPMAIDNFRLSPATKALLREKNIEALFPIQAGTLHHLLDGADLVGRARTGCGKTLAFVLPIVERLMDGEGQKRAFGRKPQVIVLAPTRELAKQVHADFEFMGRAAALRALCLYGGTPYADQERVLARGCDVVVGTPGRVKDHLERGTLDLQALRFRVLDECDEMLNMGFVDDVERILNAGGGVRPVQTLLFSATLPAWVKDITKRFLKPGHQTIDLVGSQKMKASTTVRHLVLPCHWSQRGAVAGDLIRAYAACGRAIVFTDTKRDADELATTLADSHGARPLHGDIPQAQREVTLKGFREGKFDVLVATDVAARGLDISGVELVVQCEPPKDPEIYIHRSGRTGRAGSTGVSVVLADKRKEGLIPFIARKAGVAFERVGAPQPAEMARIAGERAVEALQQMDAAMVPLFRTAAAQLLAEADDPERVLAAALAKITGFSSMRARSLLTAHEDFTTLQFHAPTEIQRPGYVFTCLKRALPDALVEDIKRLALTADGLCAVFDVPSEHAEEFLAKFRRSAGDAGTGEGASLARGGAAAQPYLTQPAELPELKAREGGELQSPGFGGDGARGGYGGGPSGGFRGGGRYGAWSGHGQAGGRDGGRGGGWGGARGGGRGGGRGRP